MLAWHIGMKDLKITLRDKGALGILLAMPMALILILGSALGGGGAGIAGVKIAVVDLDQGKTGARVTDAFFTNDRLKTLFDSERLRDPAEARALVARGDLAGALVVPADFTKRLNTGKPVQLTVYTDPGRAVSSGVLESVARSLSTQVSAAAVAVRTTIYYISPQALAAGGVGDAIQRAISSATATDALSAVTIEERNGRRGHEISNLDYYGAGMSIMFLLFGAMYGAFSLVRERADWTLPRMLASPARKTDILGGKMLGVFAVGALQWSTLFAFTRVLGVNWGTQVAVAWLLALSTVAAATGLAVLLAALGRTVRAVGGIGPAVVQLMAVLGGSMIPISVFPAWLRPVHYLTVNGWAVDGMLAVMRGGGLAAAWPSIVALLALGAAFFAAGVWRLRWE